jgi:mercuric ion transport protein
MTKLVAATRESSVAGWLTLFTSTGTLICCALPITLVTLGLGASVVSLTSAFPFLIVLSQHKIWVFGVSAVMLSISGWLLFRSGRTCPTDPAVAAKCAVAHRWNKRVMIVSAAIWTTGFTTAYLLLPVLKAYDRVSGAL